MVEMFASSGCSRSIDELLEHLAAVVIDSEASAAAKAKHPLPDQDDDSEKDISVYS